jgi:hypothetical protein
MLLIGYSKLNILQKKWKCLHCQFYFQLYIGVSLSSVNVLLEDIKEFDSISTCRYMVENKTNVNVLD